MFDLVREILQTLRHNKLRFALTGFAVAWGIFMLIVLLSLANGIVNSFRSEMMSNDNNVMTVWGGVTSKAYQGFKEGRSISLEDRDIDALMDVHGPIGNVAATISNDTICFSVGNDKSAAGYSGMFPRALENEGLKMIAGRFINEQDMKLERKVVVFEENEAKKLFGSPDKAIGAKVKAMGLSWTVIGVYNHRWRIGSYIPYNTALALDGHKGDVGSLSVEVKDITTVEEGDATEQRVRETLARQHSFDSSDQSAVWVWNRFSQNQQAAGAMQMLVLAMWIIGVLTLLSGIVGVSNIMFVSVKERTHEIGIRRAIGARRRNILTQIILESVAITTIFGYIGIVLGTVVMGLISSAIGDNFDMLKNPSVDLSTAFAVTGILIVAGAFAGLFPAFKATKVKPVEALRDE